MALGGKLIFLLMSCFDKMARGGLQSFFQWLPEHSADTSTQAPSASCLFSNHLGGQSQQKSLTSKHRITASLAKGIEFFLKGIPLLKPRIYHLGAIRRPPVVIYSDAEWTVLENPPSNQKGFGRNLVATRRAPLCSSCGHAPSTGRCAERKENTDYPFGIDGSCKHVGDLWTSAQRRRRYFLH